MSPMWGRNEIEDGEHLSDIDRCDRMDSAAGGDSPFSSKTAKKETTLTGSRP